MLFPGNLARYLLIFLPLTSVLGLTEGCLRGMWSFAPSELWHQFRAWGVFEAPGLLIIALPIVLLLPWLVHRIGRDRPAPRERLLAALLAPVMVWIAGAALGPFGGQLFLSFPFAWIASGIVFGLVLKLPDRPTQSSPPTAPMSSAKPVLLALLLFASPSVVWTQESRMHPNTLSSAEKRDGWRLLFDGTTTDGWRGFKQAKAPAGWKVVDGTLTRVAEAGDLITADQFSNFELALEWKIVPGGNSGIMYRVTEEADATYETGPEMQVLDDARHPDGQSQLTAAGSCFGLYPAPEGVVKPAGEWNAVRLVVKGNHVEHWLNGTKVVEYELGSPDWEARVKASKFAQWPGYGRASRGHIALQDHEAEVAYRGIKVRVLP